MHDNERPIDNRRIRRNIKTRCRQQQRGKNNQTKLFHYALRNGGRLRVPALSNKVPIPPKIVIAHRSGILNERPADPSIRKNFWRLGIFRKKLDRWAFQSRLKSDLEVERYHRDFSFTPENRHQADIAACPKSAMNGSGRCKSRKEKDARRRLFQFKTDDVDQAAINAGFDFRR